MGLVDLESVIAEFLDLGRRLQSTPSLTGSSVVGDLTKWYRSTRIIGTDVEQDDDMLLFQWETERAVTLVEPTDLRNVGDDFIECEADKRQCLEFARQVYAHGDDPDADFDYLAVQMSLTVYYGPETGDEPSPNLWIKRPADIEAGLEEFLNEPYAQSLLHLAPNGVRAFVNSCG
ncbi:MAG: hypothetical protein ABIS21_01775 [Acidimicrobiales bacterium]